MPRRSACSPCARPRPVSLNARVRAANVCLCAKVAASVESLAKCVVAFAAAGKRFALPAEVPPNTA